MSRSAVTILFVLVLSPSIFAQTSASYKLREYTFNNGGDPANGSFASSASYRIKLDAVGDAIVTGVTMASASQHLEAGFVGDYPPPGEVRNDRFTNRTTFVWDPEKSIGTYGVYRNALSTLPGNFGTCFQSPIASETITDATNPAAGTGWFYLVTARNRLGEEGTKGFSSSGVERANSVPCP